MQVKRKLKPLLLSALTACFLLTGGFVTAQSPKDTGADDRPEAGSEERRERRPEGRREGERGERRREGREGERRPDGFPGRPPMFRPGQILPPMMVQRLELSSEQIEQLEDLQKEVATRLEQILTPEQRAQMRELAARGPQRRGDDGRRPGGERRGPGAERQRPDGERDADRGDRDGRGGRDEPRRGAADQDGERRERTDAE